MEIKRWRNTIKLTDIDMILFLQLLAILKKNPRVAGLKCRLTHFLLILSWILSFSITAWPQGVRKGVFLWIPFHVQILIRRYPLPRFFFYSISKSINKNVSWLRDTHSTQKKHTQQQQNWCQPFQYIHGFYIDINKHLLYNVFLYYFK